MASSKNGRFTGASYRAANWIHLGLTQGRGRQDQTNQYAVPVKDIYVYPLRPDAPAILCDGPRQEIEIVAPPPRVPVDWAEEEFGAAESGDVRRVKSRKAGLVPRQGKRPKREAELEIRFAKVTLKPPQLKPGLGKLTLWAMAAVEVNYAPEVEEPIEWLLLTTLAIETFEQATEKLNWYAKRWGIEVYHRTLKSGCKIETRQLGKVERLEPCLAIDLVVAWRIFHLTKLGREVPNVPCTIFFEEAEWKALVAYKTKNPHPPETPPTLREAVRMVASLGGFLGRKCDGEPGTKSLWLGLQRLDDLTAMWKIATAPPPPNSERAVSSEQFMGDG